VRFGPQVDNVVIYTNDHLGTPQMLTAVNGAVVWSAKYSSFGKADVDISSSLTNNLRFPGQYFDSETGLHYNWHRYYEPKVGRYLTPDPIGLFGGINLFTYVSNTPINSIDPFGLHEWSYFHSHSGEYSQSRKRYAITHGPWTIFNKEFDDMPRCIQVGMEYHESLHQRFWFAGEKWVWEHWIVFIDRQLKSMCDDDPCKKELDDFFKNQVIPAAVEKGYLPDPYEEPSETNKRITEQIIETVP